MIGEGGLFVKSRVLIAFIAMFGFAAALVAQSKAGGHVKQVDAKYVCMINKKVFKTEQIAVPVEGKTYYGCCDMCKSKLTDDAKSRMDTDPVSGKEVDKATAVIGTDADGNVYFFENADNLKKFRVPAKKATD